MQMFELTEEEAIGQNVEILMPLALRGLHSRYIERYSTHGVKHLVPLFAVTLIYSTIIYDYLM